MAELSSKPIDTFHLNIRKSKSLVRLQFAIDDLLETGGERTIKKYLELMDNVVYRPMFGMSIEELTKSAEPAFEEEIQKKVDAKTKEEMDALGTAIVRQFEPLLSEITSILDDIELLRKKVLLEQAVVSAVTALEVYCGDAVSSAVELNEFIEKRFYRELKDKFSYHDLVGEGYHGRKALGTVVASFCDFYDDESLNNHFKRLLGKELLSYGSPERRELKLLMEYRNLIVHQSGVVDQDFVSRTGYKGVRGEPVLLTREMIENWMLLVDALASKIDAEIRSLREQTISE